MTDDQRIEALEQALRECAEAALDRIEALEELFAVVAAVMIAAGWAMTILLMVSAAVAAVLIVLSWVMGVPTGGRYA